MIKLPGESCYITVDGIRIHYVVAGEGRPVMLIHGLGASVVTWRDNFAALSQSHRVYAIDLPGHGDSAKPDIGYESETIVECIGKLVDELGIERPAIIGNSVGGALAMMIAFRFPDLVSGLVLVGSAGLGREISLYIRLLSVPLIGTVLEAFKVEGPKLMLANVFHDRSLATDELANELYRSRKMPGAKVAVMRVIRNTVSIGGVREDFVFTDGLKRLKAPVMVVWGRQDKIFPAEHAFRTAEAIEGAWVEVFDECGHWPHMEKADAFNSLVLRFLSETAV